jgi:hypothetical protein
VVDQHRLEQSRSDAEDRQCLQPERDRSPPGRREPPPGAYWLYAYAYDRASNLKSVVIKVTVQ